MTLVDDKEIKKLNKKFLQKNCPTDVLSFRMADGEFADLHPEIIGDVVISLETAQAKALELKTSFEYEACLYLVHGILHLLGFTDKTKRAHLEMERLQKEILK